MPLLQPGAPQNSSTKIGLSSNLFKLFPDLPREMFESLEPTPPKIDPPPEIINPDDIDDIEEIDSDQIINDALMRGGISPDKLHLPLNESSPFQQILHKSGASVENASKVIANVMMNGKFENSKLKAAEMVLDLHGIRDAEGKVKKVPNFQFIIRDSNININQIFSPVRSSPSEIVNP